MSLWKWLWPRGDSPRKVRIHLVPDSGDESVSMEIALGLLRLLALLALGGLLAMLFLIFSSSSLILEKQKNRVLERQLTEGAVRLSRMHSLERQLEESALLLYRMQAMLGEGVAPPDSLLSDQAIRDLQFTEGPALREGRLQRGERQVLRSMPSGWPLRGWITQEFQGLLVGIAAGVFP